MSKLPNIIFLDFDSVICNPATCIAVGDTGGCFGYLDPISCSLIRMLCEEHNCKIVISSSWRILYDNEAIRAILSAACPRLGRYMFYGEKWCTIRSDTGYRGKEIKHWIDKYSIEFNKFVILDDNSDMEPLIDSFVQTDAYEGFLYKDYLKAVKILGGNDDY